MNHDHLTIVMAQLNLLVGDIAANTDKVLQTARQARAQFQADLILFPELTLTGYPPEDLLFRDELHDRVEQALDRLCKELGDCTICLGHPERTNEGIYNSATVIHQGQKLCTYRKQHLPNYEVFDEKRYFLPGDTTTTFELKGRTLGIVICEDVWAKGPVGKACAMGAEILLCLNASPFHQHKPELREQRVLQTQIEGRCHILYLNCVGGQDELVFDGHSFVMSHTGEMHHPGPAFSEALIPVTFDAATVAITTLPSQPKLNELDFIYQALKLGLGDYVKKNHFPGVLVGLSGGIDSALTLALAVDALGSQQCHAVLMPSRYTQSMSVEDAKAQAELLGVPYSILPIEPTFTEFLTTLAPVFNQLPADVTEENLQARIRGTLLMALSNKTGKMLLTTGNKSEMAVGYATLYGDMAGGFAPLKDVPKTLVYRLAQYRNEQSHCIPNRVLTRPPSAELKADQTDQDSLPDYAILDGIMQLYMEHNASRDQIIQAGFAAQDVDLVLNRINMNEYKRRQSAPGTRISKRAFGRDWRLPITSGWKL